MNKRIGAMTFALCGLAISRAPALGALIASATITPQQLGPSSYQYSMTLTNSGTTPISTLWFGWFPSYDLLDPAPTGFSSPSGWTGVNAPDTFGVASAQWVTTTNPLQPGHSLSGFAFTTSESPAALGGASEFFNVPVEESYVYIGAPETDPGFAFTPATVAPEPNAFVMLLGAPAGLLLMRRKRK